MCQAREFIATLFKGGEYFELVTTTMQGKNGREIPLRRKENLMKVPDCEEEFSTFQEQLSQRYDPCGKGAWITFNPVRGPIEGKAVSDQDIAEYRYVLIEADELSREEQWNKLNDLNLPIETIVWSGGKSYHALVKVDAGQDKVLYDKRVKLLYNYLEMRKFKVDAANKNPSRLTRMPGFMRNGEQQYLAAYSFGPSSWQEFEEKYLAEKAGNAAIGQTGEELAELMEQYGAALYPDKNGVPSIPNQSFFAAYTIRQLGLKRIPGEDWRQYQKETGLWIKVAPAELLMRISSQMLEFARQYNIPSLEAKRSVSLCRDILAFMDGEAGEKQLLPPRRRDVIHVGNGMVEIDRAGTAVFKPFAPEYYSCTRTPFPYDPEAKCPQFLKNLLAPCMVQEDIDCLQLYFGQCLLGVNLSQMFLMLTGTPGSGKSTLVNVIERMISRENCTELRLEQMAERFEMNRLRDKTLLTGKDVKSYFLTTRGAYKLKALIGGDTMSTEAKGQNETFDIAGEFNVIITANSDLTVDIDSDNQAWKRRMLWIRYECPPVAERICHFDEKLLNEEGSGILNWAIAGACRLIRNGGVIPRTKAHLQRIEDLLMESDSVHAFIENMIEPAIDGQILSQWLYPAYGRFCSERDWEALPERKACRQIRQQIESKFHLEQRHDLAGNFGNALRGYTGIRFKQ